MIKVTLIVFVGLAATAMLRRQSAALRHWVLAAAIACAAATPLLELVVPAWRAPFGSLLFGRAVEPLTLLVPIRLAPSPSFESDPTAPARQVSHLTMGQLAVGIWRTGAAVSLSILLLGLARLAWIASRARRVTEGSWTEVADELSREVGLSRRVRLLESDHPALLATWGVQQPKIVLPRGARAWPRERVRIVLGHELAHVARRDWLVQMAAELLRSLYWFDPLLWIACRRLRDESEHACDDAVLGLGVGGSEYAGHLLDVARTFAGRRSTVFPAPAMARPSNLERRVDAMLNSRLNRTPMTRAAALLTFAALAGLTIPIAGLAAGAQSSRAALSGTLLDAVGRILPNATLVLASADGLTQTDIKSDEAGRFAVGGLPAGDYRLQAKIAGFANAQGRVVLAAGDNLNRDIVLQIGSLEETLTVAGGPGASVAQPARRMTSSQPEFDPCSQTTAGGCIKPPRRISDARPRYPQRHLDSGTSGNVQIDGRIGTDGFMKDLRVLAPADADFASAAVEAVSQWQFTPTRLDGVPVEAGIRVTVHFSAQP
jgi:TonB family protein